MFTTFAQRYLSAVDDSMRQVVAALPESPEFGVMLRYALGWADRDDQPYQRPTGKRLRPILLLLCAEAAGGDWRRSLPAAAAVELLHNFSLIHDDIQDDSDTRHGRPTIWQIWGRANAINAGDAMFTLAYEALQRLAQMGIPEPVVLQCWSIFNRTALDLTQGQHLDMRFERQDTVQVDEYLAMIRGKSAALIQACAQLGALIATGDPVLATRYGEFGQNLGIGFQIRDDILGKANQGCLCIQYSSAAVPPACSVGRRSAASWKLCARAST